MLPGKGQWFKEITTMAKWTMYKLRLFYNL